MYKSLRPGAGNHGNSAAALCIVWNWVGVYHQVWRLSEVKMSKGSESRVGNIKRFNESFDRIFKRGKHDSDSRKGPIPGTRDIPRDTDRPEST